MKKRITAAASALIMLLALLPAQAFARTAADEKIEFKEVYSEQYLQYLEDVKNGDTEKYGEVIPNPNPPIPQPSKRVRASLPEKYDPRELSLDPPPRDQGFRGICWIYSTLSSLECHQMKKTGIAEDYSENYFNYISAGDSASDGRNPHSYSKALDNFGSEIYTYTYMANWKGPVFESRFPDTITGKIPLAQIEEAYQMTPDLHVQGYDYIPMSERNTSAAQNQAKINEIKQLVYKNGAASTAINMSLPSSGCMYNTDPMKGTDHAVTIVGWDDNFPVSRFQTAPPGPGAFIVRNSWGPNAYDGGYFYLSYYDVFVLLTQNYSISKTEPVNNYYKNYSAVDFMSSTVAMPGRNSITMANVFTRDVISDEYVDAVGFFTCQAGTSYQIYVNPNGSELNSDSLIPVASGTIERPGYNTIPIDKKFIGSASDKFAVAVKLTLPAGMNDFYMEIERLSSSPNVTIEKNTSFYTGGELDSSWTDAGASNGYNFAIRAYTNIDGKAPVNAETPKISAQPSDKTVSAGETTMLSVSANVARGALTYQWYEANSKTNNGGTPIAGATSADFIAPTNAAGTKYYYCVVTNTDSEATGFKTANAHSAAVSVRVSAAGTLPIFRTRVNSWEASGGDAYKTDCLYDGDESTYWHAKWNTGSGLIGKGEAFVDIDLGSVKTISKIELDKRVREATGYDPIKGLRLFVHSENGNIFPNGETMSSNTAANVSTSQISADFAMTGWNAVELYAQGLTESSTERQTVTLTPTKPITARYIRLGVTCHSSADGGNGYAQVSEIRVFDGEMLNAETPQIIEQPTDINVIVGQEALLSVTANVGKGTLSYQWYENETRTNVGGKTIAGATGSSYKAPTDVVDARHYYCVITNTDPTAPGSTTSTAVTNAVTVKASKQAGEVIITPFENSPAYGSVSGGGIYEIGSMVTLTATPNAGYELEGWYLNGKKLSSDMVYTFPASVTGMYEAKFVKAEFKIKDVKISGITAPGSKLTFTADVSGGATPLKYAFYIVGGGNVYYKSAAFTASNSFAYTPNQTGEYTVIAYAVDSTGKKYVYTKAFKVG